jgi:hypothetical protein
MYTTEPNSQFAICIIAEEMGDLEVWKIYQTLPDSKAAKLGCLRVIDESGEDYLYPANRFVIVELPEDVREKLLAVQIS